MKKIPWLFGLLLLFGIVSALEKEKGGDVCTDRCGDGICQRIVCMAVGCPCPETPELPERLRQ
jgi:hypothetical protein